MDFSIGVGDVKLLRSQIQRNVVYKTLHIDFLGFLALITDENAEVLMRGVMGASNIGMKAFYFMDKAMFMPKINCPVYSWWVDFFRLHQECFDNLISAHWLFAL